MEKIKVLSDKAVELGERSSWLEIRHINLGLLPTSRLSWEDAVGMLGETTGGWVHVHENVDIRQMDQKRDFVVQQFQAHLDGDRTASCSRIERVKTYAPGVMHCVFDMHIAPTLIAPGATEKG